MGRFSDEKCRAFVSQVLVYSDQACQEAKAYGLGHMVFVLDLICSSYLRECPTYLTSFQNAFNCLIYFFIGHLSNSHVFLKPLFLLYEIRRFDQTLPAL